MCVPAAKKPRLISVTGILNRIATSACASSWIRIDRVNATTNANDATYRQPPSSGNCSPMTVEKPSASSTATGSQVTRIVSLTPLTRPSTQVPGVGPAGWTGLWGSRGSDIEVTLLVHR